MTRTFAKHRRNGEIHRWVFDSAVPHVWDIPSGKFGTWWFVCPHCEAKVLPYGSGAGFSCGSFVPVNFKPKAAPTRCDHRCEGATGPNCDCKCGGKNHGAAAAL